MPSQRDLSRWRRRQNRYGKTLYREVFRNPASLHPDCAIVHEEKIWRVRPLAGSLGAWWKMRPIASARTMGMGDPHTADQAAVESMRRCLDTIAIDGTIVIGEGEARQSADALHR